MEVSSAETFLLKTKPLNKGRKPPSALQWVYKRDGFFNCFGQKHLQTQVFMVFTGRFATPQWAAKSHLVSFPHGLYLDIYSQVAGEGNKPVFQCAGSESHRKSKAQGAHGHRKDC